MKNALGSIIDITGRIEEASVKHKTQAEKEYEQTFMKPDDGSLQLMADVQNAVDSIFDSVVAAESQQSVTPAQKVALGGSKFSKAVEAISGLHESISKPLVEMMGVLSVENAIGQKLLHVSETARFLIDDLRRLQSRGGRPVTDQELADCANLAHAFLVTKFTAKDELSAYEAAFSGHSLYAAGTSHLAPSAVFYQFVGSLCALYAQQLEGILKHSLAAFQVVMSNVSAISAINEDKQKHADTMYVINTSGDGGGFVKASIKESVNDRGTDKDVLGSATTSLDTLSDDLNTALFNVISNLSFEDMLGQRLRHVISSCHNFQTLVTELKLNSAQSAPASDGAAKTQQFLAKVFKDFAMEDERRCFQEAFGRSQP